MSATCNFNVESADFFELESQDQLNSKQRRAIERAKTLSRKRQHFERTRVAHSMPPRRGAPHRAARSANRTSLAVGAVESGADITVISVPDRQNLQRKKHLKKASAVPTLKRSFWLVQVPMQQASTTLKTPSLWPVQKATQQSSTVPTTSFSRSASAMPRPFFCPSAEALPTFIDSIEEDSLDMSVAEQLDLSECEDEEQPNIVERQEETCRASTAETSDKEACFSVRQQVLGQLMDKLCAQNGGLQQQQVAASQIQDLFRDLEAELQALQKESNVSDNAVTCMKTAQEKQPPVASGKWPKLQEGAFNLVGRFLEKAEVRLGSTTGGFNEHIEAFKLSSESLASWPSNNPLQQQSEQVAQKLCEAFGPLWQGAECLAKDAKNELAKTAAVAAQKPPSFKTWLEDPFASVSKKLEAASQKFEADASRFMDRIEALKHPAGRNGPSSME